MKGIEISKAFWEEYGKPVFEEQFAPFMPKLAVGLIGQGSECFGFDDEFSKDHDFDQGFCVFLPGEDIIDRRTEFLMERAYASLPKEYKGLVRDPLNPAGGNRRGIFRRSQWFETQTGLTGKPQSVNDWLRLPEPVLAEVTNGEVFFDGDGEFSSMWNAWKNPPKDVQNKKLCGYLLKMSQAGEYNFPRTQKREDIATAHLVVDEFVTACLGAYCWTFSKPVPYYKWKFALLRKLPDGDKMAIALEDLLTNKPRKEAIDDCCQQVLKVLKNQNLLPASISECQMASHYLNKKISDGDLRNRSLLAAVD